MTTTTIEKRSRIIIGVLALVALFIFLATTFGSSNGVLIGTITIGILISLLLFAESGIVSYVKKGEYRTFTFGDIMVYIGVLAGAAILIFSISLIPTIGQILPLAIKEFTTTFARIIASVSIVIVLVFIFTDRFS